MLGYLSLESFYSFPRALLSKNTSLFLGTDNVHGQISKLEGYCLYIQTDEDNCEIVEIHSLLCVVLYIASVLCFSSVNTFSFCCAH